MDDITLGKFNMMLEVMPSERLFNGRKISLEIDHDSGARGALDNEKKKKKDKKKKEILQHNSGMKGLLVLAPDGLQWIKSCE